MAPYAEEGCKLFVYGVNENTSNSELSDAFSKYGTVVDTYNTGKGYAFVTFDNKEDAQTATDQLNGQEILGQQVKLFYVHIQFMVICFRWRWMLPDPKMMAVVVADEEDTVVVEVCRTQIYPSHVDLNT